MNCLVSAFSPSIQERNLAQLACLIARSYERDYLTMSKSKEVYRCDRRLDTPSSRNERLKMAAEKPSQGNGYILLRGGSASARLSYQHFAMLQMQGWTFHPNIQAHLTTVPCAKIADLATGNGIWAQELAEKMPEVEIVCTDITDSQFPHKLGRPSNTKWLVHDLFEPPPKEYLEYFDVVHLRLSVAWIIGRDCNGLVNNILAMLKPGGWIQWEEIVSPPGENASCIWAIDPQWNIKRELPPLWNTMFGYSNMMDGMQWAYTLPEVFKQLGLEKTEGHEPKPRPSVLTTQKESLLWSSEEVFEFFVKSGKKSAQEDLEVFRKEVAEFYASGWAAAYGWMVAIGQKPS